MTTTPSPRKRPSWKQKLLLAGFGLSLVILLDLFLHLAGFGGHPPLLRLLLPADAAAAAGGRVYEVNPHLGDLFFSRRTPGGAVMVGSNRRELVTLPKPPGTLRVVFVGASTVEGFPLPRNLTASRFLEALLRHALPGRKVEVVNLGMSAIASFPVMKIGEAALDELDPDLLVVYGGHNEFFGASGVASFQFMGRSPTAMEIVYLLRRTALVQAARALVADLAEDRSGAHRQLIQVMAGIDVIPPEGELHRAALASLEASFGHLLRRARRRGVPAVLATVVSNERDLAPIASFEGDLPEAERPAFRERLSAAEGLLASDPGGALAAAADLVSEAPRHAGATYLDARALEAVGRRQEAAELYRRARDLDAMPWRASRAVNRLLRKLASREGATLADCEASFSREAGGATTWDLFYDHVHPSLKGQALLARTIYDAIARERLLPLDPAGAASLPDWHTTARALGANPLEHFLVTHKMATLFRTPPIGDHNEAAEKRLAHLLGELRRAAGPVGQSAITNWEHASAEVGFALPISLFGASAALRSEDARQAALYAAGAVGNAYALSDERLAAEVLELTAWGRQGDVCRLEHELPARLREAARVAATPGQPTALQARAMAGMLALAGNSAEAAREEAKARELEPDATPVARAFLRELPGTAELAALGAGLGRCSEIQPAQQKPR